MQASRGGSGRRDAAFDRVAAWAMTPRGAASGWMFAAAAFVAATGLRLLLDPYLPSGYPFLTFFPAVAITALLHGVRPGTALAVVCFATAWLLFIPPAWSLALTGGSLLALLLYVIVIGTELVLVFLMRRGFNRAAAARAEAAALAESRGLMFAELQHRVSNNLGVVASLLQLQRRGVADPAATRALDEAARRVATVARLSRLLHDPEAQGVDFGGFLRAMAPDAVAAGGADGRVSVAVDADAIVVPADQAIPLGLIATELLSNAIEHGFPQGRGGRVAVSLRRWGDGHAELAVHDDGAGLPPGFDLAEARSLGLVIARQFATQMGGTLTMEQDGGAVARLSFPLSGSSECEAPTETRTVAVRGAAARPA